MGQLLAVSILSAPARFPVEGHRLIYKKEKQIPSPTQPSLMGSSAMDKVKSATQTANDASTLGSDKRMLGFITSSMVGVVCFILGPKFGLVLSFSTLGLLLFSWYNPAFVTFVREAIMKMVTRSKILSDSIQSLMERVNQVKAMYEKLPALAVSVGLVLSLCAVFWWLNLGLVLSFSTLGHLCSWCSPTYGTFVREAIMKPVPVSLK